jgi:hypothetical protein
VPSLSRYQLGLNGAPELRLETAKIPPLRAGIDLALTHWLRNALIFLEGDSMNQGMPPIVIDPTEYAAVTVLLRAAIAAIAGNREISGPGGGQEWINSISAACQTAIQSADISADLPSGDIEVFRRKTMEHINRMLAGLAPQTGAGKPNN